MTAGSLRLGPIVQGSLLPVWALRLKQTDNNDYDLTGATFAGVLFNVETSQRIVLGGSFAITGATTGQVTYTPVAADVATPGEYLFELQVTQSAKSLYLTIPLTIMPRLAA